MEKTLLDKLVSTVLYEGYVLYPYRSSAIKNRQRFTFGRVYPETYSTLHDGKEPCFMRTEVLFKKHEATAALDVTVRFLHPLLKLNHQLPSISKTTLDESGVFENLQEAEERTVTQPTIPLVGALQVRSSPFTFPSSLREESDAQTGATVTRKHEAVEGVIDVTVTPLEESLLRISITIKNTTPVPHEELLDHAIVARTLASTHTVLRATGGDFVSLLDPPAELKQQSAACNNVGTWPVLVGDEAKHERDTMLSSPIILYDYPKIAAESPGDFFDGTEIDEMLSLRVMTLTDDEKMEMKNVDAFARTILERTDNLGAEELMRMHGTMREVSSLEDLIFKSGKQLETVMVQNVSLRAGDRVRLQPRSISDIIDIALNGRTAIIEAIEEDAEGNIHIPVVLDDDPGKDLGFMRQIGHRFFFSPKDVEPIPKEDA